MPSTTRWPRDSAQLDRRAQPDISTLLKTGHFYLGLTLASYAKALLRGDQRTLPKIETPATPRRARAAPLMTDG
jgi:hypothetical protein